LLRRMMTANSSIMMMNSNKSVTVNSFICAPS
jgi:hypothetical protein